MLEVLGKSSSYSSGFASEPGAAMVCATEESLPKNEASTRESPKAKQGKAKPRVVLLFLD